MGERLEGSAHHFILEEVGLLAARYPDHEALLDAEVDLLPRHVASRPRAVIGQTFPVADAAGAHGAIERRETIGKSLLRVSPLD
jgi:NADPH2:quinone reductase